MVDPRLYSSQAPTLPTGVDDLADGPSPLEGPTAPTSGNEADHEPLLSPGDAIGRFTVTSVLGEGGMGVVYSARDPELGRELAVKVLHRSVDEADERARVRLLREARAMASVSHPNLVTIYDVGNSDGRVFIAMEKITGRTLGQWRRDAVYDWREIVQTFRHAGEGLLAAHEEGLVHRDFKPGNVLISDRGRVQVVDFGLARAVTTQEVAPTPSDAFEIDDDRRTLAVDLTRTGTMVGTPAYMSPEQFQGQPTDPRTDQFSFCIALWESLFHERPFEGSTAVAVMFSVIEGRRRPAPTGTDVPLRIVAALERGLQQDPAARFPSMRELLDELDLPTVTAQRPRGGHWSRWVGAAGALTTGLVIAWALADPEPAATPTAPAPETDTESSAPTTGLAALDGYQTRERGFRSTATLWHAAQQDFARACEAAPDHARWCAAERFGAGQAALEEHRLPDAESAMRAAIERDPGWALPHIGLAGALRQQGRLDDAMQASISAQGIDPGSWVAVASAAATHVAADRLDDAIDEYLRALEMAPDHPDLLADLALVYHARRLDSQAERYATAALTHDPESMPALMLLAERALEDGHGELALDHADRAVAVGSKSVTAWLARGDALLLLGRETEARESLERAVSLIELDPDHGAPPARLAQVTHALARDELPELRYRDGALADNRSRAAEEAAAPAAEMDEPPLEEPQRSKNASPSRKAKRSKKATGGARPKASGQGPPG